MSSGHDGESPGSVNQQAGGTGSQGQAGLWGTDDKATGQERMGKERHRGIQRPRAG